MSCVQHYTRVRAKAFNIYLMLYLYQILFPDTEKFADEDRGGFYFNWLHLRFVRRRRTRVRVHRNLGGLSARCCQSACGLDQLRGAC